MKFFRTGDVVSVPMRIVSTEDGIYQLSSLGETIWLTEEEMKRIKQMEGGGRSD